MSSHRRGTAAGGNRMRARSMIRARSARNALSIASCSSRPCQSRPSHWSRRASIAAMSPAALPWSPSRCVSNLAMSGAFPWSRSSRASVRTAASWNSSRASSTSPGCHPSWASTGICRVSEALNESIVWMRKSRRVLEDAPAAFVVARQGRPREGVRAAIVVGRGGGQRRRGSVQRLEDAALHLAGGLAREGDGQYLLGAPHGGEEPQGALDEEPRLARPGRRLHDEGERRIERPLAYRGVGNRPGAHSSSPSASGASSPASAPNRSCTRHSDARSQCRQVASGRFGSTCASPLAKPAATFAVSSRHPSSSSRHDAASLRAVAMLLHRRHAGQQALLARDAREPELARLEAGEGDGCHLLARGERIERQLRIVGPLAQPAGHARGAGLVVDDREAAVAEPIEAVDAAAQGETSGVDDQILFALHHGEGRAVAVDGEPLERHAGEPRPLQFGERSIQAAGAFRAQPRHRDPRGVGDQRLELGGRPWQRVRRGCRGRARGGP